MKKSGISIMVICAIAMVTFGIVFYHGTTDNVVDSDGFWAYVYGANSVPWLLYSGGVVFLMGMLMFLSSLEQKSTRFN
jgi:hypothetical protein